MRLVRLSSEIFIFPIPLRWKQNKARVMWHVNNATHDSGGFSWLQYEMKRDECVKRVEDKVFAPTASPHSVPTGVDNPQTSWFFFLISVMSILIECTRRALYQELHTNGSALYSLSEEPEFSTAQIPRDAENIPPRSCPIYFLQFYQLQINAAKVLYRFRSGHWRANGI